MKKNEFIAMLREHYFKELGKSHIKKNMQALRRADDRSIMIYINRIICTIVSGEGVVPDSTIITMSDNLLDAAGEHYEKKFKKLRKERDLVIFSKILGEAYDLSSRADKSTNQKGEEA